MDLQEDEDFEKAWQANRHIWESTKNLAKAMFYAGQAKAQVVPDGYKVIPANYECVWCGCTELDGWTDEAILAAAQETK